eukprot:evm.model.scf_4898.1 EVM.evm.TU.scf_4898.1   scf_4898:382-2462(-)
MFKFANERTKTPVSAFFCVVLATPTCVHAHLRLQPMVCSSMFHTYNRSARHLDTSKCCPQANHLGTFGVDSDTPSVSTGEHCQSAAALLAETQKPAASPQSRPSGLKKGFFNSEKSRTTRKAKGRKAAVAVADAPDNVQGSAFTGKVLERVASTPTTIPPKPVEGAAPGDAMLDAGENVGGTSQAASQPSSQKKPVSRFKQQMMALKAGLPPE